MEINKILTADYLDILFEGRNKSYGSYEMRKQYKSRVLAAGAISILIIGGLFASLFIKPKVIAHEKMVHPIARIIELPPLPSDKVKPPPPPLPPVPPPLLKAMNKLTPPVIRKNDDVKEIDQPKEIKKNDQAVVGLTNVKGSEDPTAINPYLSDKPGTGKELVLDVKPAKDLVYTNVEQKPEFGGDINKYLASHINYPNAARAENIQGRVTLSFVLDELGNVTHVKVERDIGGGCGAEAKRIVSQMKWKKPAIQNGHPVKMYYLLNVNFNLQ